MDWLESFIGELKEEARLSDTSVPDDDVFEEVGVGHVDSTEC